MKTKKHPKKTRSKTTEEIPKNEVPDHLVYDDNSKFSAMALRKGTLPSNFS
jgi:hypothetical protein